MNEEYFDGKGPIDLKVKIITVRSKDDVLKEYIEFAHRSDDFRKSKKKPSEKEILQFIDDCIRDGILSEFLSENKEEVMNILTTLFDQDYVSKMYDKELLEQGMEQGINQGIKKGIEQGEKKGIKKGSTNLLKKLVKEGIIEKEEAKKQLEDLNIR